MSISTGRIKTLLGNGRFLLWVTGSLLYLVFFSWYTNFDGPLREDEIEAIMRGVDASNATEQRKSNLRHFMETDTGNDFVMVNLLDLNNSPPELQPDPGPAPWFY